MTVLILSKTIRPSRIIMIGVQDLAVEQIFVSVRKPIKVAIHMQEYAGHIKIKTTELMIKTPMRGFVEIQASPWLVIITNLE